MKGSILVVLIKKDVHMLQLGLGPALHVLISSAESSCADKESK